MPSAQERQLFMPGIETPAHRKRKARSALKRIPESKKSAVLEGLWTGGVANDFDRCAQIYKTAHGSLSRRNNSGTEYVSADMTDQPIDIDDILAASFEKVKRRGIFAAHLVERLTKATQILANGESNAHSLAGRYLSHVIEIVGKTYHLEESYVDDLKRQALAPAQKLEPRLR